MLNWLLSVTLRFKYTEDVQRLHAALVSFSAAGINHSEQKDPVVKRIMSQRENFKASDCALPLLSTDHRRLTTQHLGAYQSTRSYQSI